MSDTRKEMELDIEEYLDFCKSHNIEPRMRQAGYFKLPCPKHMNRVLLLKERVTEHNKLCSLLISTQGKVRDLRFVIDSEIEAIKHEK